MQNIFPKSITKETDLKLYEDFLNKKSENLPVKVEKKKDNHPVRCPEDMLYNPVFLGGYLKKHIGKLCRVESFLGGNLESRVGILYEVGADFLVLKLNRNSSTMVIEASAVKYVTIIHDNDFKGMH